MITLLVSFYSAMYYSLILGSNSKNIFLSLSFFQKDVTESVCLFPNSSKMTESNKFDFLGKILLGVQIDLGKKIASVQL